MEETNKTNTPFSTRLKALMANENECSPLGRFITQAELAQAIGITRQAISAYIIGNTSPRLEEFQKIADFFNVTIDYLSGKDECTTPELQEISKRTGLSEKAIRKLELMTLIGDDSNVVFTINQLIENEPIAESDKLNYFPDDIKLRYYNPDFLSSGNLPVLEPIGKYLSVPRGVHEVFITESGKITTEKPSNFGYADEIAEKNKSNHEGMFTALTLSSAELIEMVILNKLQNALKVMREKKLKRIKMQQAVYDSYNPHIKPDNKNITEGVTDGDDS